MVAGGLGVLERRCGHQGLAMLNAGWSNGEVSPRPCLLLGDTPVAFPGSEGKGSNWIPLSPDHRFLLSLLIKTEKRSRTSARVCLAGEQGEILVRD